MKVTSMIAVFLLFAFAESKIIRMRGKGTGLFGGQKLENDLDDETMADYSAGGCPDAKEALKLHNSLRRDHHVGKLHWDNKLAKEAQEWAQKNAAMGMMKHSTEEERHFEGENLAFLWVGTPDLEKRPAQEASKMWADEERFYSSSNPYSALHFTQMAWEKTTKIGIGCAKSGDMEYVCARYDPRGNFDSFEENVKM